MCFMSKIDIKELEKAVKYIKDKLLLTHVELELSVNDRVLLKAGADDHAVIITLYRADTNKFADITETRRL